MGLSGSVAEAASPTDQAENYHEVMAYRYDYIARVYGMSQPLRHLDADLRSLGVCAVRVRHPQQRRLAVALRDDRAIIGAAAREPYQSRCSLLDAFSEQLHDFCSVFLVALSLFIPHHRKDEMFVGMDGEQRPASATVPKAAFAQQAGVVL